MRRRVMNVCRVCDGVWRDGGGPPTVGAMPRVSRSTLDDGLYHVTGNAVAGERLFRDSEDYERFLLFFAARCPPIPLARRHLVSDDDA